MTTVYVVLCTQRGVHPHIVSVATTEQAAKAEANEDAKAELTWTDRDVSGFHSLDYWFAHHDGANYRLFTAQLKEG